MEMERDIVMRLKESRKRRLTEGALSMYGDSFSSSSEFAEAISEIWADLFQEDPPSYFYLVSDRGESFDPDAQDQYNEVVNGLKNVKKSGAGGSMSQTGEFHGVQVLIHVSYGSHTLACADKDRSKLLGALKS